MGEPKKKATSNAEIVPRHEGVQVAPVVQDSSAEALISQAITSNVPVETLERLLAMRRELKAERAKELFDEAMAKFQMQCPVIKKLKAAKDGTKVLYKYAPLDSIVAQTKDFIQKNGFSYKIDTETIKGEGVKVTCIVKHSAGHSESSTVDIPLGKKTQIMSDSQQVAAALTFAKRYAFCNAFGILTSDEDTDGPKDDTPPPAKGNPNAFTKVIETCKDVNGLFDLQKKLKASDKYSAEEKASLGVLIDNRITALSK